MTNLFKIFRLPLTSILTLLLCSVAFSQSVHVNIVCSSGGTNVYVYANATPGSPFAQGELDLEIQGPDYTSYKSTSGMTYLTLQDSAPFYWDSAYSAVACAYFEDDYGAWANCDYDACITQIEPTQRSVFFDSRGRLKTH